MPLPIHRQTIFRSSHIDATATERRITYRTNYAEATVLSFRVGRK